MTSEELAKRQERARSEVLVITRTDTGCCVFSPTNPSRVYLVSGGPTGPTCTCPDFETHASDPDWRCKHILAVQDRKSMPQETRSGEDSYNNEERAAIQGEAGVRDVPDPPARTATTVGNGGSQMLLKRSVSPDGRIDSLSVEFACPVDGTPAPDIDIRAAKILHLQDGIVARFLKNGNGRPTGNGREGQGSRPTNGSGNRIPAVMIGIAGSDGKWGRRLFIDLQVNGRTLRLYGSQKQLAEFIERAGFPGRTPRIEEGMRLNLPCQVTTKKSQDGRFVNVDQVFPAEAQNARPGSRR